MLCERCIPAKIQLVCTADQLTVDDLINYIRRLNKSIALWVLLFLGQFIATLFGPYSTTSQPIALVSVICYSVQFGIGIFFAAKPILNRILYPIVSTGCLFLLNVGISITLCATYGPDTFAVVYVIGALNGMCNMYLLVKLRGKFLLSNQNAMANELSGSQRDIDVRSPLEHSTIDFSGRIVYSSDIEVPLTPV
jgi:hypothetical protein